MKFLNAVPKSDDACTVQEDKAWRYKKKKKKKGGTGQRQNVLPQRVRAFYPAGGQLYDMDLWERDKESIARLDRHFSNSVL